MARPGQYPAPGYAPTRDTKASGGVDTRAGGGESAGRAADTFGGMNISDLLKQLGVGKGGDIKTLEQKVVFDGGMDPAEFAKLAQDPNGASRLIAAYGPQTETGQAMDFVSPSISDTTGGRPGDAARAARAQMTGQFDPDAPPGAAMEAYFRGQADAARMAGLDMGAQMDVSASGVRPTGKPKKQRTPKDGKAQADQSAGGDGAAAPPADGGGGSPPSDGNPGGPAPGDGKKPARGGPRGGYLLALQDKGARLLAREIPGIATATAGAGGLYALGDYLVGGKLSQGLGLTRRTEDEQEQAAARAVMGQLRGQGYGRQDAGLWGVGGDTPNNPAGSMAADQAIVPTSPPPSGQMPVLGQNRFIDALNRMGTIGGQQ